MTSPKGKTKLTKDVKNFVDGMGLWLEDKLFGTVPTHIKEQALYRASLCSPCLLNGKCTSCGCKTPQMFYSPKKADSKGKWGYMLDYSSWQQFKKENEVHIPESFLEIIQKIDDELDRKL